MSLLHQSSSIFLLFLQLSVLCKKADPQNFKDVQVINLRLVAPYSTLKDLDYTVACVKILKVSTKSGILSYSSTCVLYFVFSRQGSIVAETVAQYNYPNNASQINFLNNELESTLTDILNDTNNLENISQALGNVDVQLSKVTMQSTPIMSE